MYTTRVHRARELRPRHGVLNQWDLLEPLGIAPPDEQRLPVEMVVDPSGKASIDRRLGPGARSGECVIVVHVSAGNRFRRWPLDSFAVLVSDLVSRKPGRRVIVTSGPSERIAAARVVADARARVPESLRERLEFDELTLPELRALMDRAALFIGGDSGPLHVAATSQVPIVGLYGPTLPVRSAPWRDRTLVTESVEVAGLECRPCDQRVCAPGDFRCLTRLGPHAVIAAAERALARAGTPATC
jgi:ADP-heptose:LPS heptosyltransferase